MYPSPLSTFGLEKIQFNEEISMSLMLNSSISSLLEDYLNNEVLDAHHFIVMHHRRTCPSINLTILCLLRLTQVRYLRIHMTRRLNWNCHSLHVLQVLMKRWNWWKLSHTSRIKFSFKNKVLHNSELDSFMDLQAVIPDFWIPLPLLPLHSNCTDKNPKNKWLPRLFSSTMKISI